jgi:hypothetical protein
MTTSSSDRNRCTRISPSAVLDDRLDGKDLEWARDHLRRCEACRERVEDFREMLLRVGRLPSAVVGAAAMDEAFTMSVPEQIRGEVGASRTFQLAAREEAPPIPGFADLPPMRPEVTSAPDLLTELEREIFRDEPAQDHPTPLAPVAEPILPTMAEPSVDQVERAQPEPEPAEDLDLESMTPALEDVLAERWRQVPVDSHRAPPPAEPQPEPALERPQLEDMEPPVAAAATALASEDDRDADIAIASPPRKADTPMRIAVGLSAAACVLLAALLYEGGWLSRGSQKVGATTPATSTARPSATARLTPSPSASPSAAAPAAPVLFRLGNGVSGGTVYRIRPGTAVAGYTRLVFDIRGNGLPTMVITRPDDLHVAVTFNDTSGAGLPVNGIHSYQVSAIEPAAQEGANATVTIDLARPVRVTAFTLPATAGYAWRLVVDLHTS